MKWSEFRSIFKKYSIYSIFKKYFLRWKIHTIPFLPKVEVKSQFIPIMSKNI